MVAIIHCKFNLGQLVITPAALQACQDSNQLPLEFLQRHWQGDWGEVGQEDWQENELSLVNGFRLLSAYITNNGTKLWILTEADRSVTTILLPSEY